MTVCVGVAFAFADPTLNVYIRFSRPQKYLVFGENTGHDFLICEGNYSSKSVRDLRISLKFRGPDSTKDGYFITANANASAKYSFKCKPNMPLSKDKYAPVSSAFCSFGLNSSKLENAGDYICNVESSNHSIPSKKTRVSLQIYGEFFLRVHHEIGLRTGLYTLQIRISWIER